jgi:hypothetical protein
VLEDEAEERQMMAAAATGSERSPARLERGAGSALVV